MLINLNATFCSLYSNTTSPPDSPCATDIKALCDRIVGRELQETLLRRDCSVWIVGDLISPDHTLLQIRRRNKNSHLFKAIFPLP